MSKINTKRRQELNQQRKQKRQKQLVIGVISLAILLVVVAVLYFIILKPEAELPSGVETAYEGLPQTVTSQGYGILGSQAAPIVVKEYSSFACPHCKDLQPEIKSLKPYIADGSVQLVFVPIYNIAGEGADEGARAAVCAGEQGKFFEMHDTMFHWQGRYGYGARRIESAADKLGLNVDEFMTCYNSSETKELVRGGRAEFDSRGFTGTPVVTVNDSVSGSVYADVTNLLGLN